MLRIFLSALTCALLASSAVAAQGRKPPSFPDSSVAAIVARPAIAANILRQTEKPQSRAKLDLIADELVRLRAVDALHNSASRRNKSLKGTPYPGAQERLIRIYETDAGTDRLAILRDVLDVPPHAKAVDYLIKIVATGTEPLAYRAITNLEEDMRETVISPASDRAQTTAALKSLWLRAGTDSVFRRTLQQGMERSPYLVLFRLANEFRWPMPR